MGIYASACTSASDAIKTIQWWIVLCQGLEEEGPMDDAELSRKEGKVA
jgi:hypothetical protein